MLGQMIVVDKSRLEYLQAHPREVCALSKLPRETIQRRNAKQQQCIH